jgi:hypothetical protein
LNNGNSPKVKAAADKEKGRERDVCWKCRQNGGEPKKRGSWENEIERNEEEWWNGKMRVEFRSFEGQNIMPVGSKCSPQSRKMTGKCDFGVSVQTTYQHASLAEQKSKRKREQDDMMMEDENLNTMYGKLTISQELDISCLIRTEVTDV